MNLQTLRARVARKIKDTSFTGDDIDALLNQGVREVSGLLMLDDLETNATLYVGTASYTATTLSFSASESRINDSDSGFITQGFHAGQTITISGAGESGNNQTTTISSVASDGSYIVVAGTLTEEAAGESITIANSGPSYVPLPSNYQKNLFKCYSDTRNRWVHVYGSLRLLLREFSYVDRSGAVRGVAVRGSNLHYQLIPSSPETLYIYYYRKPTDMSDDDDTPDGIPESYHEDLLINFALKWIYSEIEDGIEGRKVNTAFHQGEFDKAFAKLSAFLGPEDKEPYEVTDELGLEGYL